MIKKAYDLNGLQIQEEYFFISLIVLEECWF